MILINIVIGIIVILTMIFWWNLALYFIILIIYYYTTLIEKMYTYTGDYTYIVVYTYLYIMYYWVCTYLAIIHIIMLENQRMERLSTRATRKSYSSLRLVRLLLLCITPRMLRHYIAKHWFSSVPTMSCTRREDTGFNRFRFSL